MSSKTKIRNWFLVAVALISPLCLAAELKVGSSTVKGDVLRSAQATWYTATRPSADAEWTRQGEITETIQKSREGGRAVLTRVQVTENKNRGVRVVDTVVVDAETLKPLRWSFEQQGDNLPENAPIKGLMTYNGKLVSGEVSMKSGATKPVQTESSVELFDAGILGLLITALPLESGYETEIPALFRGRQKYMIRAKVTGRKDFKTEFGQTVSTWAVKTDWKALDSDDPYPDDDSGGTFYVVQDPPTGFPHVPRYVNANFDTQVMLDR